ncbi:MAG: hypothetical protein K6F05_02140 [Succinivibrio sp.]|nr:hypothetical protein [Succinivibrio sp.]
MGNDVHLGPNLPQQVPQNNQNEVNVEHNPNEQNGLGLAQEVRPSRSLLSSIGHSIAQGLSRFGQFIQAVAVKYSPISGMLVRAAEARHPKTAALSEKLLPESRAADDKSNTTLNEKIRNNQLSEKYQQALNDAMADLKRAFGDQFPQEYTIYQKDGKLSNSFTKPLKGAIEKQDSAVDAGKFYSLCKEAMLKKVQEMVIKQRLDKVAEQYNTTLKDDINHYINLLNQIMAKKKLGESQMLMTVGDLKDKNMVESFFSNLSEDDLKTAVLNVNFANLLSKGALGFNQQTTDTFKAVAEDLQKEFGIEYVKHSFTDLIKQSGGGILGPLQKKALQSTQLYTTDLLKAALKNLFTPTIRQVAIYDQIVTSLKDLNDEVSSECLPKILAELKNRLPQLETDLDKAQTRQEIKNAFYKYTSDIKTFLAEQTGYMQALENKYADKVSEEVKPLLKKQIRSFLYTAEEKELSNQKVQEFVQVASKWKNFSLDSEDSGIKDFCNTLKSLFQQDLQHLRDNPAEDEGDNMFIDPENKNAPDAAGDIYNSFKKDFHRSIVIINGQEFDHKPLDEALPLLKQHLTTPRDLQFVSKLANQRADANVFFVQTMGSFDGIGKIPVTEQMQNSGLLTRSQQSDPNFDKFDMITQPYNQEDLPYHKIELVFSADNKEVTFIRTMRMQINADNGTQNPNHVGYLVYQTQVKCQLSGGDESVQPSVTEVRYAQTITGRRLEDLPK